MWPQIRPRLASDPHSQALLDALDDERQLLGPLQAMIDDAIKAITQLFSPPLRAVLWRSIGLALALIVVVGIALERLIVYLVGAGGASVESNLGAHAHMPVSILAWLLSIAAGIGIVASFFADKIADRVEREYYPADPPGKALPLWLAMWEGLKTALLALVIYLCAAPLLLFVGFGVVIFFLATAYILGREYFELAAMRLRPPAEAKALRKRHAALVYVGGLFIAAFVSIPIVNLATPMFAMTFMVHLHKRLGVRNQLSGVSNRNRVGVS